jgi:hypothetical protein
MTDDRIAIRTSAVPRRRPSSLAYVMTPQPTPTVTSADVERIVRRDFPGEKVSEAFAILGEYGKESWHREVHRVRAAALKLAAGSLERLRCETEGAKCDYRDVLAAAEYPGYLKQVPGPGRVPADQEQRIVDADWKQYQDWFTR